LIEFVTEALRDLKLVGDGRRPRYNIVITKGASYVIEAHPGNDVFYHIKATEMDRENIRSCFEATRRARRVFDDFVPEPMACLRKGQWEVFVSEGVHFEPLRRDELLSSAGSRFKQVINLFSCESREARIPATVPHSRFLIADVLGRIGRADLEAVIQPFLSGVLLGEMDRLPHVCQHGDLVMNNLGVRREGLVVFDWEDFGRLTLPGVDVLTLLLSLTDFDGRLMRSIMKSSPAGGKYQALLMGACQALAMDPTLFRRLVPLYLLEFLYLKYDYTSQIQEKIAALIPEVCR
jgi:hypothetical protein